MTECVLKACHRRVLYQSESPANGASSRRTTRDAKPIGAMQRLRHPQADPKDGREPWRHCGEDGERRIQHGNHDKEWPIEEQDHNVGRRQAGPSEREQLLLDSLIVLPVALPQVSAQQSARTPLALPTPS